MRPTSAFSVEGKSTIVTGAAMGIGFGIAKRFVEAGANVLLVDVNEEALERAAKLLKGEPGRTAVLKADIGDATAPAVITSRCIETFGGVDVLINNAGIFPQAPALTMAPEVFDRVLRINLRGLVFLSQAVAARMVSQGRGGKIINIGSIDSLRPSMVGLAAYDASKGGVLMFTRSLALELAPHGIHVNAILPGAITTEGTSRPLPGSGMSETQMKKFLEDFVNTKIPLRRMGEPDDIAKAVLFLGSSASDYVTGAELVVDGGALLT